MIVTLLPLSLTSEVYRSAKKRLHSEPLPDLPYNAGTTVFGHYLGRRDGHARVIIRRQLSAARNGEFRYEEFAEVKEDGAVCGIYGLQYIQWNNPRATQHAAVKTKKSGGDKDRRLAWRDQQQSTRRRLEKKKKKGREEASSAPPSSSTERARIVRRKEEDSSS
ncbi:hypothetical protein DBV15_04611 [Temnothorax longispinosus]|uniref:Uncharacterized protein n=1 Tax=Temnothorax longispinosus TaxID=300112 RepID=A0A4V6RGN4_9HYME|nr:hypothetical protein DBV15_04611 [Temnothorax longispinosus]